MKIMLYAYVDKNIGDDLFIDLICQRYKQIDFYLYVPEKYVKDYSGIQNLHCISYKEFSKNIDRLNRWVFMGKLFPLLYWNKLYRMDKKWIPQMDAQLWLGGSQFVETNDWKQVISYKIRQQKIKQIPFFSISATIGPYKSKEYEAAVRNVIKGYNHIVFRDKCSYNKLLSKNNATYAYDMVFTKKSKYSKKKKEICVSVIDTFNRTSNTIAEKYEKFIGKIVKHYIDLKYEINFLSLCENQHDGKAIERIIKLNKLDGVKIWKYNNNLEEILDIIDSSEIMIGTRYHSIVLSLEFGLKVLPLSYESKTDNLLEMLGEKTLQLSDLDDVEIENIENRMIYLNEEKRKEILNNAELQYREIDKWVRKKNDKCK